MSKKQDKTRELELKITDKKVIDAIINLKLGEERERERIMKIIDEMPLDTRHSCGSYGIHLIPEGCTGKAIEWDAIDKQDLKQKIVDYRVINRINMGWLEAV